MNTRFDEIYSNNEWKHGSGEGSLDTQTKGYQRFLQQFLMDHNIRTVVDMGCGDWQFSRNIDWAGITYKGYDVAQEVIEANKKNFSTSSISFHHYAGDPAEFDGADLLIVKDVLQHLPNELVQEYLAQFSKFKYALITNCTNPIDFNDVNKNTELGGFRYIDIRKPPFNMDASQVFTFAKKEISIKSKIKAFLRGHPGWRKLVLLLENAA